jgi:hypothetical protein
MQSPSGPKVYPKDRDQDGVVESALQQSHFSYNLLVGDNSGLFTVKLSSRREIGIHDTVPINHQLLLNE